MDQTPTARDQTVLHEDTEAAWPGISRFDFHGLAGELMHAAQRLAAAAGGCQVGATVGLASSRPEHYVLARLICCHGARVYFFCTQPVIWQDEHALLFRALRQTLDRYHDQLDCEPVTDLTRDNFAHGQHFAIVPHPPDGKDDPMAGSCDVVLANDLLGDTPEDAEQSLRRLGILLRGGGRLELFGCSADVSARADLTQQCARAGFALTAGPIRGQVSLRRLTAADEDERTEPAPFVWKARVAELEQQLREERGRLWAERNRFNARLERLRMYGPRGERQPWQLGLVHVWFRGGGAAYASDEIHPGDWIQHFADLLATPWQTEHGYYLLPPVHWQLVRTESDRVLDDGIANPLDVRTVLFPRPGAEVGFRSLWFWVLRGAQCVWFHEVNGWKQYDLPSYLVARASRFFLRRALPVLKRWIGVEPSGADDWVQSAARWMLRRSRPALVRYPHADKSSHTAWNEWLTAQDRTIPRARPVARRLEVVHYTGSLQPGGAERQLCNLAIGQVRRGMAVRVLSTASKEQDHPQYTELLAANTVPNRQAQRRRVSPASVETVPWHLLRWVPHEIQDEVVSLVYDLLADPPDVLHGWLDQPNLIAGIAGLLVGVPTIVLSTRNVNPTHFPRFCEHYFRAWYQILSRSNRVHLIANSHPGAASYAEWLGLPVERFHVVCNGVCFDHFPEPTPQSRQQARQSFGLSAQDRVVCGIFRLAEEKQPELFLDVVRRVHERIPRLHVLLAGEGDLEASVRQVVHKTGMDAYVQFLGRRSDVGTIFLASDASLLTSSLEGCPNVALESQYLGVPIVATAGGGTVDAVHHGVTGFLTGVRDADALTDFLTRILADESLRQRLSLAGPRFVQQRFALEHMVEQTLAVYEAARAPASHRRRIVPREPEPAARAA
jgi:glycosyltransferase involved in cell wall biosynthesis